MVIVARVTLSAYYFVLFALPALVFAQGRLPAQIVPCAGAQAGVGSSGPLPACGCQHIVDLIQNIVNTGIVLVVVLSALLFAYAGFLYVTNEAIGAQQQAKSIFKNVAIGLVIMLIAWLVVDTLMSSTLSLGFGRWSDSVSIGKFCEAIKI